MWSVILNKKLICSNIIIRSTCNGRFFWPAKEAAKVAVKMWSFLSHPLQTHAYTHMLTVTNSLWHASVSMARKGPLPLSRADTAEEAASGQESEFFFKWITFFGSIQEKYLSEGQQVLQEFSVFGFQGAATQLVECSNSATYCSKEAQGWRKTTAYSEISNLWIMISSPLPIDIHVMSVSNTHF